MFIPIFLRVFLSQHLVYLVNGMKSVATEVVDFVFRSQDFFQSGQCSPVANVAQSTDCVTTHFHVFVLDCFTDDECHISSGFYQWIIKLGLMVSGIELVPRLYPFLATRTIFSAFIRRKLEGMQNKQNAKNDGQSNCD